MALLRRLQLKPGYVAVDVVLLAGASLLAYWLVARSTLAALETIPWFVLSDPFFFPIATVGLVGVYSIRAYRQHLFGEHISWWYQFGKRELDILICLLLLAAFAPFLAIVAILIKLESRGPVFFRQIRVGKGLRPFHIYKFRTMYTDVDEAVRNHTVLLQDGSRDFFQNDPRVTPIGRFLRRFSIDEIPQLINVLKGEMSWIGPRPHIPEEVARYTSAHLKKYDILPGVTGLSQIKGRKNLTQAQMAEQDLHYVKNVNLFLDIQILLQTLPAIFTGKGAY